MIKLSKLRDDELISFVDEDNNFIFMEKQEFIESSYKDFIEIYTVDEYIVDFFSWEDLIKQIAYENDEAVHEDWESRVYDDISAISQLKETEKIINKIFKNNKTYHHGKKIINDLLKF